jgi:hypothetical protein
MILSVKRLPGWTKYELSNQQQAMMDRSELERQKTAGMRERLREILALTQNSNAGNQSDDDDDDDDSHWSLCSKVVSHPNDDEDLNIKELEPNISQYVVVLNMIPPTSPNENLGTVQAALLPYQASSSNKESDKQDREMRCRYRWLLQKKCLITFTFYPNRRHTGRIRPGAAAVWCHFLPTRRSDSNFRAARVSRPFLTPK